MAKRMKMVYYFGDGKADGKAEMKELLGGKGANLAEMNLIGIPVPAGFTITTEACTHYYEKNKKLPEGLNEQIDKALRRVERAMKKKYGDPKKPLLLSVRSGARQSMPGMMETVLNVGLTSDTLPGVIELAGGNERFAYDSYRRLIMMYSDVVMEKAAGMEPKEGEGIRHQLEQIMDQKKKDLGVKFDKDLDAETLKELCEEFKKTVKKVIGKPFPDNARDQLMGAILAVFQSWMGKRAIEYRRIERIPDEWGTAVNVQAMVFGNMGEKSATGVAFTRNPATGENKFFGEYLVNAQGEDVVAGTRTPSGMADMKKWNKTEYQKLVDIRTKLEKHYKDMQDVEFTIEEGRLWMLQTRTGKRTGTAAVRMAMDMLDEKLIDEKTALMRVKPTQLNELLLPSVDRANEKKHEVLAKGLPAGPGGSAGRIVFTADDAEEWAKNKELVILVRNETSPEDVAGMHAAAAVLTAKGGMTSHAALVARGWGKTCIVGCGELDIDVANRRVKVGGKTLHEGDWITLNGTAGRVYEGQLKLNKMDPEKNKYYKKLMKLAEKYRQLNVRANVETGPDSERARKLGAEGIGLCRTEHMFFEAERISAVREMIVAKDKASRQKAIMKLLPHQRKDFIEIFTAMKGLPVTIRLLDPPLHEFTPGEPGQVEQLAHELGVTSEELSSRIKELHELNPMLGHRGCRLGVTYPEITEMQARAIFEATAECKKKKVKVLPEVMVPLVGHFHELRNQAAVIHRVAKEVMSEKKVKFDYQVGTMIELPRAALTADQIAEYADFFSFGTNDLTQTTFGFSRDDIGTFLPDYLEKKILPEDPFQSIDQDGVGQLVQIGIDKGRATRKDLKVGICGEHGGDPESVWFCAKAGMNYVSCSPFRVPIALFSAAQARIRLEDAAKAEKELAKKTTMKKKTVAKAAATKKKAKSPSKARKAIAKVPAKKTSSVKKAAAPKKKAATKKAAPKKAAAKKTSAKAAAPKKKAATKKAAPKKAAAKKTSAKAAAPKKKAATKKAPAKKGGKKK